MSSHDVPPAGSHSGPAGHDPGGLPATFAGSGGELGERFTDPGLPAHIHRSTDVDPRAAKRAERQISLFFLLSILGTAGFIACYFAFDLPKGDNYRWSTLGLGGCMFVALFSVGAGAIQWAKKLMPDEEVVEERHPVASTLEDQQTVARMLRESGDEAGFLPRRKMIWGTLAGALGAASLMAIIPLKDLWTRNRSEKPEYQLAKTAWRPGIRLALDPTGEPIKAEDIPIGGVVHVLPAIYKEGTPEDQHVLDVSLNDRAKAAVLVLRLAPGQYEERADRKGWDYQGIFAYSKICTHVGCPVGLYEQTTHHLLCPCHQSTFDATRYCKVIFGPAARPLPQLAIAVDSEGYLVAQHDFTVPVGPSFWERN